jgi:hypothetical protein
MHHAVLTVCIILVRACATTWVECLPVVRTAPESYEESIWNTSMSTPNDRTILWRVPPSMTSGSGKGAHGNLSLSLHATSPSMPNDLTILWRVPPGMTSGSAKGTHGKPCFCWSHAGSVSIHSLRPITSQTRSLIQQCNPRCLRCPHQPDVDIDQPVMFYLTSKAPCSSPPSSLPCQSVHYQRDISMSQLVLIAYQSSPMIILAPQCDTMPTCSLTYGGLLSRQCTLPFLPASWDHHNNNLRWSPLFTIRILCLSFQPLLPSGRISIPTHHKTPPHVVLSTSLKGTGLAITKRTGHPLDLRHESSPTLKELCSLNSLFILSQCTEGLREATTQPYRPAHSLRGGAEQQKNSQHQYGNQPTTAYVTTAKGRGTSAQIFSVSPTGAVNQAPPANLPAWPTRSSISIRNYAPLEPCSSCPGLKWSCQT